MLFVKLAPELIYIKKIRCFSSYKKLEHILYIQRVKYELKLQDINLTTAKETLHL